MADWLEIAVRAGAEIADDVAAELGARVSFAAAGTELRADEIVFWVDVADGEQALAETRSAVAAMASRGIGIDPGAVTARPAAPEAEWRDAWKRYFRTVRLTRQIVVVPSWDTHDPGPDDVIVHLDPGQAFGTGAHASTRLVLEEMQALRDAGFRARRVLDLGCGSGILAIAAVRLWPASSAVAIDIDPIAVATARENCEINAVLDRVQTSTTDLSELEGTFDLVLANIQADVLAELAPGIAARTDPAGRAILSGLLSPQAAGTGAVMAGALGGWHPVIRPSTADPEWSSVALAPRKPA